MLYACVDLLKSGFKYEIILVPRIFFVNFDFENGEKMNFRMIMKNYAADSEKVSSRKIDSRAFGTHASHPTAWELKKAILI